MAQTTPQVNAVKPTFYILILVSLAHFLNDSIQAVVPALFPFLQKELALSYTELGIISFVLNITSSFLQPALGKMSDIRPRPFLLPIAMVSSGIGLLWIAVAGTYWQLIVAALFIGLGSALFHPEGSKVAYLAAGNQRNFAQSIYQAGGNFGHALAPIFTILIFLPLGMKGAYGLSGIAFVGFIVLALVSKWYSTALVSLGARTRKVEGKKNLSKNVKVALAIIIFITLIRSMYGIGLGSFYQFHLIENYGLSIKSAQLIVFAYLLFGVVGTFWGGKVADKIGKRNLLVLSVSTVIPLGLVLPYAPLVLAVPLLLII
ncbi:MAG: MFS transporter, partial [Bacilli bacterium]